MSEFISPQSPGLHHTHLARHWDTHLGLVTSVWDRLMGTLYIPDKYQTAPWGLLPEEQARYTSSKGNLQTPFVEIYKILRRRFLPQRTQSGSDRA